MQVHRQHPVLPSGMVCRRHALTYSLVQWLQHSQKSYCELCQYPFVFHKRYTQTMPQGTLPVWLYVRYLAQRATQALRLALRVATVLVAWLLVVPYVTRRIWCAYMQVADTTAAAILGRPVAAVPDETWPPWEPNGAPRILALVGWCWSLLTRKWLTGMVLTISLGIVFVSCFFMRDYIVRAVNEATTPPAAPEPAAPEPPAPAPPRVVDAAPVPLVPAAAPPTDDDAWTDDEEIAEPIPAAHVPVPAPAPVDDDLLNEPLDDEMEEPWENDEHWAEDVDGVLHAIGVRGTWWDLAQNLLLVETLVLLVMTVCVMVPYSLGRVLGLRFYDTVFLSAKALRVLTDPVFELLIHGLGRMLSTSFEAPSPAPPSAPPTGILARALAVGARLDALTRGGHALQRALCIVLGHAYIAALLQLEARYGHWVHGGSTRTIARVSLYYLLTLKVFFFSAVDLFVFPVLCGVLLDGCTLPLFAGASLAHVWAQALAAPLPFVFLRWASGTVYMFFFSQTVGAVRSVVRPGVVYFLGDTSDPDFNPLHDILQQGTLVQLVKLTHSAAIYAIFSMSTLGLGLRLLQAVPGLLPLVWQPYTPRTLVPVELLLVHFGLRVILKRARCAHRTYKLLRWWWMWTARSLRMSAYLMGDEQPLERGHRVYASWSAWARSWVQPVDALFVPDGGYMRVPADDRPAARCAVLIPTDAQGEPVDARARAQLDQQLAALARMKDRAPYTIVYMPPRWRLRLLCALVLFGVLCMGGVLAALGVPLAIGRALAWAAHWAPMHDTYTVLHGYLVLAGLVGLAQAITVLRPQRRAWTAYVADVRALVRACGRFAFHFVCFGGLVPLLVGLVVLQYAWPRSDPTVVPTYSAWFAWAMGALLLNTSLLLALTVMPDEVPRLWDVYDHLRAGRLWRVPVGPAARHVLWPIFAWLLAALVAPYMVALFCMAMTADLHAPIARQQQYVCWGHYTVLGGIAAYALERYVLHRLGDWTQALRDELFLESTELVNYGSEALTTPQPPSGGVAAPAVS